MNGAGRGTDSPAVEPEVVVNNNTGTSADDGHGGPDGGEDDGLVVLGLLHDDDDYLVTSIADGEPEPEPTDTEVFDPGPPVTRHEPTISDSETPAGGSASQPPAGGADFVGTHTDPPNQAPSVRFGGISRGHQLLSQNHELPTPRDLGGPDDIVDAIFVDADEPIAIEDLNPDGSDIADEVPDISDIPGVVNGPDTPNVESAHIPEPTDSVAEPVATASPEPPSLDLEMRQVAGLTAGSSMRLLPGRTYEFSESTKGVSFGVKVLDNGNVIVLPGSARAIINEVQVTEPTFLGDGVLHVETACFSVRPVRSTISRTSRSEALQTNPTKPGVIVVPPLDTSSRPSPTMGRIGDPTTPAGAFLNTVRLTRDSVAERHRLTHPDPEEIMSRLARLEPGLLERGSDHRLFGRFSVAYATIPWQPRFDTPELIPEHLHQAIIDMSLLPWVPVTVNLRQGPLGIVGSRTAALACARHAVLSLAALTAPGDIGFWVLTGRSRVEDWQWTTSLPISMSPEAGASFMVAVVDGMGHFENADLDQDEIDSGRMGVIALATDEAELPKRSGSVLRLQNNGSATVTNHLGETIPGTPIGVTQPFALDMAGRIADVLADIKL